MHDGLDVQVFERTAIKRLLGERATATNDRTATLRQLLLWGVANRVPAAIQYMQDKQELALTLADFGEVVSENGQFTAVALMADNELTLAFLTAFGCRLGTNDHGLFQFNDFLFITDNGYYCGRYGVSVKTSLMGTGSTFTSRPTGLSDLNYPTSDQAALIVEEHKEKLLSLGIVHFLLSDNILDSEQVGNRGKGAGTLNPLNKLVPIFNVTEGTRQEIRASEAIELPGGVACLIVRQK